MGKVSEIDVMKTIDGLLSGLEDQDARNRVLGWAWEKYSSKPPPPTTEKVGSADTSNSKKKTKKKAPGKKSKTKGKAKKLLEMDKDLNLKPKGKKSFDEFVEVKKPSSNYEKCAVSTYYLKHELGLSAISEKQVYTCFKHMKWRIPADLSNTLSYTSSHYGWLDTSNLKEVKITTIGENFVEYDLPKDKGPKKS